MTKLLRELRPLGREEEHARFESVSILTKVTARNEAACAPFSSSAASPKKSPGPNCWSGTSASKEMQWLQEDEELEVTPFDHDVARRGVRGQSSGSSCGILARHHQKSGTVRTIDAEMCSATSSRRGPGARRGLSPEKTVLTRSLSRPEAGVSLAQGAGRLGTQREAAAACGAHL